MKRAANARKPATRAAPALQKIAKRKFSGKDFRRHFYDALRARCEEIARPLVAGGFFMGDAENMQKIFESGLHGEKWYSWLQYFVLCYINGDAPLLARSNISRMKKESADVVSSGNSPYGDTFPNIRYERAQIVCALSSNYPHSSPYYFLLHALGLLAARPGFFAPSFSPVFYHYLNEQDYDMVLACSGLFFQECAQHRLYASLNSTLIEDAVEVVEWILARPAAGAPR